MNKNFSETLNIVSKRHLQVTRKVYWKKLLANNDLDLDIYTWWTQIEKDLERTLWAEADADYERSKEDLLVALSALSDYKLSQYMKDIGVSGIGKAKLSQWLAPSLVD